MKWRWLGLSTSLLLWLAAAGCGGSAPSAGPAAASAGQNESGGSGAPGGSPSSGGNAAGGSSTGAGASHAGAAPGGSPSGGAPAAPQPSAGAAAGGAPSGLVACDPTKVLCKLLPAECPPMEVRAVKGTCWGECVAITQCACSSEEECPNGNEYTCWSRKHCGPFVR